MLFFKKMCWKKFFEVLKSLKEPQESGNLVQRLGDFVDNLRAERERKQTEGLLERREDRTIRKAVEVLEGYVTLLKKEQTENWEEAFDICKECFRRIPCVLGCCLGRVRFYAGICI